MTRQTQANPYSLKELSLDAIVELLRANGMRITRNRIQIIETLLARVEKQPRVWAWNMLVTAMRLSHHRDFAFTAARFHVWLAATDPGTIADSDDADQRKFSAEKIAALEREELGES